MAYESWFFGAGDLCRGAGGVFADTRADGVGTDWGIDCACQCADVGGTDLADQSFDDLACVLGGVLGRGKATWRDGDWTSHHRNGAD